MMTRIDTFSDAYYIVQMTIQPFSEGPAIERGLYELINKELYAQTNAPVTMRIGLDGGRPFQPKAENTMPTDVLAMPRQFLDNAGIHPSEEDRAVLIYKPKHATNVTNRNSGLGEI
jgi:hypothetical protein